MSGNSVLFDRKIQVFQKLAKLTIFGVFYLLLSTQNVNIAHFARNAMLNETFSVIFKHRANTSNSKQNWTH